MKQNMVSFVQDLQNRICSALEAFEPKSRFQKAEWQRPGGGGGDTRVLAGGEVFEKAGVNTSVVHGELPESMLKKLNLDSREFFATGISLVIHPFNPQVPTVHANYRYFEQENRAWFGGGADLTPYVYDADLFKHFHQCMKAACDTYSATAFADFKKQCDDYFYIPHRDERRGIGGIFFDYLEDRPSETFSFVKEAGEAFLKAYIPIVEKTFKRTFNEREKKFQLLRRGRYVEFNLVYDRGTKFGLETKGNIESILMSLPAVVNFDYSPNLEATESEINLMRVFKKAADWV